MWLICAEGSRWPCAASHAIACFGENPTSPECNVCLYRARYSCEYVLLEQAATAGRTPRTGWVIETNINGSTEIPAPGSTHHPSISSRPMARVFRKTVPHTEAGYRQVSDSFHLHTPHCPYIIRAKQRCERMRPRPPWCASLVVPTREHATMGRPYICEVLWGAMHSADPSGGLSLGGHLDPPFATLFHFLLRKPQQH